MKKIKLSRKKEIVEEVEEIIEDRPIKKLGKGAGVYVPKKYLGRKAVVGIKKTKGGAKNDDV